MYVYITVNKKIRARCTFSFHNPPLSRTTTIPHSLTIKQATATRLNLRTYSPSDTDLSQHDNISSYCPTFKPTPNLLVPFE